MADPSDSAGEKGNGEEAPLAGERLARARRAREISLPEIAKDLHLDEPKVRALELNDFEALGAPVFAKGYLRKYAELVGVPEDDVIADYYRLNRSAGAPPLVTRRPRQIREFSPAPWIGGLAAVLVMALAASWWFSSGADWLAERRGETIETPATAGQPAVEEAGEPAIAETPDDAAVADTAPAGDADAAGSPGVTEVRPADTAPELPREPAPASDGALGLRLAFTGDCWTEVTDGNGERLYFGLGTTGDEVAVAGEPPLNVLLGDSDNVSVFVDGSPYPIPASARRGETARLTLIAR